MARLKQAYYGSCFVASCMHLQLKKVDPFITKRAHQISVTWAHGPILLFLGNYSPVSPIFKITFLIYILYFSQFTITVVHWFH